ncbi:MAG: hypothetical protein A3H70_01805 [Candidatus Komeilibacteria bacterium RIFCSPLOWO2_02_FULL_48_11]|uniref:Addiction module toxin RelE n=1 Tax=Candidatus Komeilibacteria bacterium RIFCSPLOWO2_02_FULL_48_11 TaxID=1798553 RepID=A0A1G2BRD4_9BACT|nr:MAG: hypothetical protein A3H70_01805 [Candidatus Komeilibacteria bacterium RIFCSPLOWO2_02_FULL_48_11]
MEVERHADIAKDFKKLKRYPAPQESLDAWCRLFCSKGLRETPGIDAFNDFGNLKVFKARAIPLRENAGKSHGYRLIFQLTSIDKCRVLVFSRHGIYHDEKELISTIKYRLRLD